MTYDVLLSSPRRVEVELSRRGARRWPAGGGAARGSRSGEPTLALPWHAYARSGEVDGARSSTSTTAGPRTTTTLARLGIDVRGQDRAGPLLQGLPRGQEPGGRAAAGVAALITYSDPAEDGYVQGDVYPEGPVGAGEPRPARRQRLRLHRARRSADPGLGLGRRARGASRKPSRRSCPKIPTVPLSFQDAREILRGAGRPGAPRARLAGRRALRLPRRAGPGAAARRLDIPRETAHHPQRDRPPARRGPRPGGGRARSSCSPTTTTPGRTAAWTRPRARPPRSSWPAPSASCARRGHAAAAHASSSGSGTRRSSRSPAPRSGASSTRTSCARKRRGLPERGRVHLGRPLSRQRRALAAPLPLRGRARACRTRRAAAPSTTSGARETGRTSRGLRRGGGREHRGARVAHPRQRQRLHGLLQPHRRALRGHALRRALRRVPLDLRLRTSGCAATAIPASTTTRPWRGCGG